MTASEHGLVALAAITLALLIALLLGGRGAELRDDHTVLALEPSRVQAIAWSGPEPLRLIRTAQGWQLVDDPTTPVIARAVDDVLTSLRGARWHRRAAPAYVGAIRRTVTLALGAVHHTIDLGAPLVGTEQSWIAVDHGDALLVDNWLVGVLDPTALTFRDRSPLAGAVNATTITIRGTPALVLTGNPRRLDGMLVAPARVDALDRALADLQLVSIEVPSAPITGPVTTITIDGVDVRIGGSCRTGGIAVVVASARPACADAATVTEVHHAIDTLAGPLAEVIDPRPAASGFDRIELADGTVTLGKRPTVTIHDVVHPADLDRIAELLGALAEPGKPEALSTVSPAFTLVIPQVGTLDVFADRVQRRGDPLALAISPATRATLVRPARALVDAERWSEEPTTITTISLDGATYQRGAVIGEWSRSPIRKTDTTLVDALAEAVAKLHAPARTGTAATPHHLVVRFAPPIGATVTHSIELGSPTPDGCPAMIAGEPVNAPLALCVAVAALAR